MIFRKKGRVYQRVKIKKDKMCDHKNQPNNGVNGAVTRTIFVSKNYR